MTKPSRRHHLLPDQGGRDVMETLCNILVIPSRTLDAITHFETRAGNRIQCVFEPRDVNCNTCQHVWRNIRGQS